MKTFIITISVIFISVFIFCIVDCTNGKIVTDDCKIVDKVFTPRTNSTSTGTVINSNGDVGVGTIQTHTRDRRLLFVSGKYGITEVNCDANIYYNVNVGDTVKVKFVIGKYSNALWITEILKGEK